MMSDAHRIQPPRMAAWLVEMFIPNEHAEAILGDLQEEFADLAPKSGVGFARRWYWRQSAKTIVRLVGTGFRVAPWSIVGIVLGGYLLLQFGTSLPERVIMAAILFRNHHVTPFYDSKSLATHLFWVINGILIGRLLVSLIIGCFVAVAAKGREMVAAITLGLVSGVMTVIIFWISVHKHQRADPAFLPNIMVDEFAGSCMIAIGGVIVRQSRAAMSHGRPSGT
jgi:hypothetical protein